MPGMFEVQRGERGVLELRKAGCDRSAECEQKGIGLVLPSLLITEVHSPPESRCDIPHSELSHMTLRTSLFIVALVIGEETEAQRD